MLEDVQIKQYFERIGYCQAVDTTLETLSGLQWAHITHIPYENLDILAGIPLSLKVENLFQKIIVRNHCMDLRKNRRLMMILSCPVFTAKNTRILHLINL